MLESGCQYKNGASITILPIVETKAGVITDYISTNIISITDGQIVLSAKNFQKGQKPAINYGLSVSRLGGAVQTPEMKKLGAKIKQLLLSYLETRDIYELANTDEMSKELQTKLFEGKKILDNLNQNKFSPLSAFEIRKKFDPNAKEEVVAKPINTQPIPPRANVSAPIGNGVNQGINGMPNVKQEINSAPKLGNDLTAKPAVNNNPVGNVPIPENPQVSSGAPLNKDLKEPLTAPNDLGKVDVPSLETPINAAPANKSNGEN